MSKGKVKAKNTDLDPVLSLFQDLKKEISILDPVTFIEDNLLINGYRFNFTNKGAGWKYMADIYRTVASQAENKTAKPTVILKGRQVGATVMAAALSLYFAASGLYGNTAGKPPMRVMHLFPTLKITQAYARERLEPMLRDSVDNYMGERSIKFDKKYANNVHDDTITEKSFIGFNKIRVDAIGRNADRIRGTSQDVLFFDECLVYDTLIQTETGKMAIGKVVENFLSGKKVPRVQSFNEETQVFEYKDVTQAWNRGSKPIFEVKCGKFKIRCTDNHPVLTERGWIDAGNLQSGDLVLGLRNGSQYLNALGQDQTQLVLGSFLGDGNIQEYAPSSYRLRVLHGAAQTDYCKWKASMLGVTTVSLESQGTYKKPGTWFSTKGFSMPIGSFPGGKKTSCPQWILDNLNEKGLAIWYMDDGSYDRANGTSLLHTCAFDITTQNAIVAKMKSMGLDCSFHKSGKYFRIRFTKQSTKVLHRLLAPYMHPDLAYKIDNYNVGGGDWDPEFKPYCHFVVNYSKALNREEPVFDIEVRDNHNFIVTSGRGSKNLGGPIFSNCQDMTRTAIQNALPVLTASPYGTPTQGVQLYFGTPKQSGSFFWELWKESDKRFFELRCESCKHYFQLYNLENDDWLDTWVSGQIVKCPKCAFHQNKCEAVDRGRWKPTVEGKTAYTGFHFNMMLSPLYTKEDVLRKYPKTSTTREETWKNEVLGDFFSGAGQPLTIEDIENFALDANRGISKGIPMTSDKIVCMGIDWGDKDAGGGGGEFGSGPDRGQSYTAIVLISIDKEGVVTVENAFRLKKNDFMYKVDVIKRLFEAFKVNNTAVDFAFGTDITRYFQNDLEYGNRFLGCWNTGNSNKLFSYDAANFKVSLNKNMMIDEIFGMIRQGKLRFPAAGYAYDTLRWLREHCASMEVEIKMKDGNPVKTYQKGAIQNDGLMALMYAVTAYKYVVTCGFKTNGVSEQKETGRPLPTLGYLPGLAGRG